MQRSRLAGWIEPAQAIGRGPWKGTVMRHALLRTSAMVTALLFGLGVGFAPPGHAAAAAGPRNGHGYGHRLVKRH